MPQPSKLRSGRVYLTYTSTLLFITEEDITGTQTGKILEAGADAEAMEGAAYWLIPRDLLILLSYRTQDHQPRDGTTHFGLGPPQSITS